MPPKTRKASIRGKEKAESPFICPVCDELIIDGSDGDPGQESIECEGKCLTWLHRKCAGLSRRAFEEATSSSAPFHCHQCRLDRQEEAITLLQMTLKELAKEIELLKLSRSPDETASSIKASKNGATDSSYAAATAKSIPAVNSTTSGNSTTSRLSKHSLESDRRSNVILLGIPECETGSSRLDRYNSDLNEVISTLSSVVNSINHYSIKDCLRLGKFVPDSRPRPVLVKMNSAGDVRNLLAKSGALQYPLRLKPDLSPEDRKIEQLLLKERWSLIQNGVERKSIKLRKNNLLVDSKHYGSVQSGKFELASAPKQAEKSCALECNELSGSSNQSPSDPPEDFDAEAPTKVTLGSVPPQTNTPPTQSIQGVLSHGGSSHSS